MKNNWKFDRFISEGMRVRVSSLQSKNQFTKRGNVMKRLIKRSEKEVELLQQLKELKPNFAEAAQKRIDEWNQDESGYDEMLGYGGICQDVAEAIGNVCHDNGIDCITMSAEIGEQHVWSVAYREWNCSGEEECGEEGCEGDHMLGETYEIDISPYVYEEGGGYNWRKKQNVKIQGSDISISKMSYEDFKANEQY